MRMDDTVLDDDGNRQSRGLIIADDGSCMIIMKSMFGSD